MFGDWIDMEQSGWAWKHGVVERVRVLPGTRADVTSSVTVINRWAGELDEYYPGRSVINTNESARHEHDAESLLLLRFTDNMRSQIRLSGTVPIWEGDHVQMLFFGDEPVHVYHTENGTWIQVARPEDLVPIDPVETLPVRSLFLFICGLPVFAIIAILGLLFAFRAHNILSLIGLAVALLCVVLSVAGFLGWVDAVFGSKTRRALVRKQFRRALAERRSLA
jgi:hypothetical protein